MIHSEWLDPLQRIRLNKVTWMYCPGHAGVKGNERADRLAGTATIEEGLLLGKSEVLRQLKKILQTNHRRKHHSIDLLLERGLQKGYERAMADNERPGQGHLQPDKHRYHLKGDAE